MQPELKKTWPSRKDFSWEMGRRRVEVSVKLDAWPIPPMDASPVICVYTKTADLSVLHIWRMD